MTTRPAYIWDGTVGEWVSISNPVTTGSISYQSVAPTSPSIGDLWVKSDATEALYTPSELVTLNGLQTVTNKTFDSTTSLTFTSGTNNSLQMGGNNIAGVGDIATTTLTASGKITGAGINVSAPSILNLGGHISYTGSTVFNFSDGTTYLTLSPSASGPSIGASTNATVSLFSTSLGLNIGSTATGSGTWAFANGATLSGNTKTVNIGTAGAAGSTTNINIGSATASSTTTTTFYGDVVINGTTTSLNANTLTVDDKNIDLGAVSSLSNISGTITGTTTTTTMTGTDTDGMISGMTLTKVSGIGVFGGTATIISIDSATQFTFTSAAANTIGAIVFNVGGATDVTAAGGGITLKGTTDKTFNWTSATAGWTSSENISLAAGKDILLNGATSGTIALEAVAIAGTNTITIPATTGTIYVSSGTDVALTDGGTNASLTASNGGIVYSTASAMAILSGTATAGQHLQSGASGAPSWTTATFPGTAGTAGTILRSNATNWVNSTSTFADTYAVNTILYAGTANTVTGLATANSSVLVTSAAGVPSLSTTLPAVTLTTPTVTNTLTVNTNATSFVKQSATVAPTVDMMQITNTGFPIVTAGISALQVNYIGGAAAVESSASRIDITPGTTTGGTWNGFRVVPTATATTGVTYNAMKFDSVTAGLGTDNIMFVGTGYDNIINYNGTSIISGTGLLNLASVTGTLAIANGGTGATTANAAMANLMGYTSTVTSATTYVLSNTSTYYQQFTGSTAQIITLPSTLTGLSTGWTFHIVNNSTANLTVNATVATALVITVPPGTTAMVTCISTAVSDNTAWESGLTDFSTYTGTGANVLGTSPTITTPTIDTINTSLTTTGTAALWNTGITTASISIGGSLTTGGVSIAGGTTYAGTISLGPSSGTTNKTVSILNGSTAGTQTINVGSNISTSTTNMYGATVFRGISTSEGGQIDLAPANGGNTWYIDSFSSGASATPSLRIINGSTTTFQINSANTIYLTNNIGHTSQSTAAAAATITPVIILTKNVYYTGAAAALTLDTGTNMDLNASFSAMAVGSTVEWVVINEGTGSATLTSGTGHTFRGTAAVAIQTAAKLVTRKSAANTYFTYRMA